MNISFPRRNQDRLKFQPTSNLQIVSVSNTVSYLKEMAYSRDSIGPSKRSTLPDNAMLEAQQRAKLKMKDCLPAIVEKLSKNERCSLVFLALNRQNLVNSGYSICQYSNAGKDISDYVWQGCNGNVDVLLSTLFYICRYDLLENPLGLCSAHSLEQVCLSAGGVEAERLALYKVFAALPQTAADDIIANHLSSWLCPGAGRCLEETFCRNLQPNNFLTLLCELHAALSSASHTRLASSLAPFVPDLTGPRPLGDHDMVYPLPTSHPYGLCIIINVNNFIEPRSDDDKMIMMPRRGSDIDVMRLEGTFTLFGFQVLHLKDPDEFKMNNVFRSLRHDARLATVACLAVCIMTHGDDNDNLFLHDRSAVSLSRLRQTCFGEFLAKKPRLFFVQACRGNHALQPIFLRRDLMKDAGGFPSPVSTESDGLLCCATVRGYTALRSQSSGSWFISDLCASLQQLGHVAPLQRVLQHARRALNARVDKLDEAYVMQTGEETSTLMREVQLVRGPESDFSRGCVILMLLELLDDLVDEAIDALVTCLPSCSAEALLQR